jgi:hypothetical protein
MIYNTANFPNTPAPLLENKERNLKQGLYCVFQRDVLFYEAPLFFIKERGAAVAGGECGKF